MKNSAILGLEENVDRYIKHKRMLGNVYRQES